MAQWIQVDAEAEFTDEVRVYYHNGNPIAVFKLEDGFYALDDTCSHAEASLAEGEIDDDEVECPLHGARFNIKTGKNLSLPAVIPVRSYPVKIEDGIIFIQVEE